MEGTGETFLYLLAEKLHMSVADIRALSNRELLGWEAWITVRGVLDRLAADTATARARLS